MNGNPLSSFGLLKCTLYGRYNFIILNLLWNSQRDVNTKRDTDNFLVLQEQMMFCSGCAQVLWHPLFFLCWLSSMLFSALFFIIYLRKVTLHLKLGSNCLIIIFWVLKPTLWFQRNLIFVLNTNFLTKEALLASFLQHQLSTDHLLIMCIKDSYRAIGERRACSVLFCIYFKCQWKWRQSRSHSAHLMVTPLVSGLFLQKNPNTIIN